jgi:hypothetical protein
MHYHQIKSLNDTRVRSLFGLTKSQLAVLLPVVLPTFDAQRQQEKRAQPGRKRAPGAGRKRKLSPLREVLMTLVYLRHNVSHSVCGQLFGVSADVSEDTLQAVLQALKAACPSDRWNAQKHWQKGEPSWKPDEQDLLLIDSFETSVPRPSLPEKHKRLYSGKKKRHTLKTQVVTDPDGEIACIDPGHRGPTNDKTLYQQTQRDIEATFSHAQKQADLGYLGVAGMILPHRRKNKRKVNGVKNELTDEQKEQNRQLASVRVHVEHAIRRIKAWRILRENYRLATGRFATVAHATVGLVQLARLCP